MEDININTTYDYWCDGSCYHTAKNIEDTTMGMGVFFIESNDIYIHPIYRRLAISGPPGNHNNAEYLAVISALYDLYILLGARRSGGSYVIEKIKAIIHSDSQLVVRQILGQYQAKKNATELLLKEVKTLVSMLHELGAEIEFKWNPRTAPNQQEADWLSKIGNPYFEKIVPDERVAHQVEGPTPIEETLLPEMYHRIKRGLKWS